VGIHLPAVRAEQLPAAKQTASDVILQVFPENIAKSVGEGQLLQIFVFSILFGIALGLLREEKRKPLLRFSESVSSGERR
jgi:proton glutamate symport protein